MPSKAPIPAPELLKESLQTISQRGVDYDARGGERSMAHAVAIFNTIMKHQITFTEQDGWIFMLALKQARMMQGKPKRDTYVDLAGYAALAGECALASNITMETPTPTSGG